MQHQPRKPRPVAHARPDGGALPAPIARRIRLPGIGAAERSRAGGDPDSLLHEAGLLSVTSLARAHNMAQENGTSVIDVLRAHDVVDQAAISRAVAASDGMEHIDPLQLRPDPALLKAIGAVRAVQLCLLPWRRYAGLTWIATPDRQTFLTHRDMLCQLFGPVAPVCADPVHLHEAIARCTNPVLRSRAEARPMARLSARGWLGNGGDARLWFGLAVLLAGVVLAPAMVIRLLLAWTVAALFAMSCLRLFALLSRSRPQPYPPLPRKELPVISILEPLYGEPDIAPRLLRRLGRLEYPREKLDLIVVLEETDTETRAALQRARLPGWMRVITVPDGAPRTKPRALNYALDFCRGEIVGVYDAEDAPEAKQLQAVAAHFAVAPPGVACLQGALDYYNPRTNWQARCFTVEYAAWFRVMMPALQRLRLPLPLGGTTLFVRRAVLEEVGAWDAHNVTEDADLGVRLMRFGYLTEMLASATEEEANCHLRPWLRQRSRWIKGHLMTWAVHMRDPLRLWHDLGPRAFLGYQIIFLGAQSQILLAPFMWSFWLVLFGLTHLFETILPQPALTVVVAMFLLAEGLAVLVGIVGVRQTRHDRLAIWVPTLHFHHPLAAIAGWRAVWELFARPFYWAKTSHGHYDRNAPPDAIPSIAPLVRAIAVVPRANADQVGGAAALPRVAVFRRGAAPGRL